MRDCSSYMQLLQEELDKRYAIQVLQARSHVGVENAEVVGDRTMARFDTLVDALQYSCMPDGSTIRPTQMQVIYLQHIRNAMVKQAYGDAYNDPLTKSRIMRKNGLDEEPNQIYAGNANRQAGKSMAMKMAISIVALTRPTSVGVTAQKMAISGKMIKESRKIIQVLMRQCKNITMPIFDRTCNNKTSYRLDWGNGSDSTVECFAAKRDSYVTLFLFVLVFVCLLLLFLFLCVGVVMAESRLQSLLEDNDYEWLVVVPRKATSECLLRDVTQEELLSTMEGVFPERDDEHRVVLQNGMSTETTLVPHVDCEYCWNGVLFWNPQVREVSALNQRATIVRGKNVYNDAVLLFTEEENALTAQSRLQEINAKSGFVESLMFMANRKLTNVLKRVGLFSL